MPRGISNKKHTFWQTKPRNQIRSNTIRTHQQQRKQRNNDFETIGTAKCPPKIKMFSETLKSNVINRGMEDAMKSAERVVFEFIGL